MKQWIFLMLMGLAAWLDPSIITREQLLYRDVNINHGPGYGDTLT